MNGSEVEPPVADSQVRFGTFQNRERITPTSKMIHLTEIRESASETRERSQASKSSDSHRSVNRLKLLKQTPIMIALILVLNLSPEATNCQTNSELSSIAGLPSTEDSITTTTIPTAVPPTTPVTESTITSIENLVPPQGEPINISSNNTNKLRGVNFTQVNELFEAVLSEVEVAKKWKAMDAQIQDGMRSILKMLFPQIVAMSQDAKVSGECSGGILKWILSLRNLRSWAIKSK